MATTVTVTCGVMPAGVPLDFTGIAGVIWNNAANGNFSSDIVFAGSTATVGPGAWGVTAGGNQFVSSSDSAASRYDGGTTATFTYIKAYIGTVGDLSGASASFSFVDTWGVPDVTPIASLTGPPGVTDWTVTQSGNTVEVTYTGSGVATQVLWVAGEFNNPSPSASNMGVGVLTTAVPNGNLGLQVLAMSNAGEPPNCLSGDTQVCVVSSEDPCERRYAALKSLPPQVCVAGVDAAGAPCGVQVHVVRAKTAALASKGRALPGGAAGAVSWSHVLLAPEDDVRRKPAHLWRCPSCRTAGLYGGPAGACTTCCPVGVPGYQCVRACDASEEWLPVVTLHYQHWYHLVPVDFAADAGKAVALAGGLLTELFRTPLDRVLAAGAFALVPPWP
jgi:hypothetical protein